MIKPIQYSMSNNFKTLSLNVRGLQGYKKRQDIFYWLKRQKADVYCLQETHCGSQNDMCRWTKQWDGPAYWTCGSTQSCGVAILLRKDCVIDVEKVFKEGNGRLIFIDIKVDDKKY